MAQFTKQALIDAFLSILETKALDKITVKDIVKKCNVNRNTFYYHFQDIYDLIEEIVTMEAEKITTIYPIYESWQKGLEDTMIYILDNSTSILNVYHSVRKEQLEQFLYKITDKFLVDYINKASEGFNATEKDKIFISKFYRYAIVGTILEWIEKGLTEDPTELSRQMVKILEGSIHEDLEKIEKKGVSI